MRLIIKEYLVTLKEKDELDFLLCDLLALDGYKLHNLPKTGERQFGVDIIALKGTTVYLFVLKQQTITRASWDSGPDSVRQSLDEIFDVYLCNMLPKSLQKYKIKIILATNGVLSDAVKQNWVGYQKKFNAFNGKPISYDFWGIDSFVELCSKHAFNEHLFDKHLQSKLRKVLYFMDESDFSYSYFEKIIDAYIEQLMLATKTKANFKKCISSLNMCVNLMCQWAITIERYKVSISIIEYCLIKYWSFLCNNKLMEKSLYIEWLYRFCELYEKCNNLFILQIEKICKLDGGIPFYNPIEHRILLYDILGRICTYGLYLFYNADIKLFTHTIEVVICLLNNNPAYKYPVYDNQVVELSLLFLLFKNNNRNADLDNLLSSIPVSLEINYLSTHKHPSPSDSYEEALQIEMGKEEEHQYRASGLFGCLFEWLCLTKNTENYNRLKDFILKYFTKMTCQTWQVNSNEELNLYSVNAEHSSGVGVAFDINIDLDKFKEILNACDLNVNFDSFYFNKYSFPVISLISSRYFHYPVLPQFWRNLFK